MSCDAGYNHFFVNQPNLFGDGLQSCWCQCGWGVCGSHGNMHVTYCIRTNKGSYWGSCCHRFLFYHIDDDLRAGCWSVSFTVVVLCVSNTRCFVSLFSHLPTEKGPTLILLSFCLHKTCRTFKQESGWDSGIIAASSSSSAFHLQNTGILILPLKNTPKGTSEIVVPIIWNIKRPSVLFWATSLIDSVPCDFLLVTTWCLISFGVSCTCYCCLKICRCLCFLSSSFSKTGF